MLVSHPWTPSRKHTKQRMHNMLIGSYCMYYTHLKTSIKISACIGIKIRMFFVMSWNGKNTQLVAIHVATGLKSNHRIIVIRDCKDLDVIQSSFIPAQKCSLQHFSSFYELRKINILINSLGSPSALWFGVRQDMLSDLNSRSVNIFLLLENINISTTNIVVFCFGFLRQG